jgi:hypothetical protein
MKTLRLKRLQFRDDGIFSELQTEDGHHLCYTLEHSYEKLPKVPDGKYKCARGLHQLASMSYKFETFEVTGVIGHTNILFHVGNYDRNSEGCILLGEKIETMPNGIQWVSNSRATFGDFMDLQKDEQSFTLIVES